MSIRKRIKKFVLSPEQIIEEPREVRDNPIKRFLRAPFWFFLVLIFGSVFLWTTLNFWDAVIILDDIVKAVSEKLGITKP